MEVILIIGIIFVVLLFLPKKNNNISNNATNLSLNELESQLNEVPAIKLAATYGAFFKILVKKYNIEDNLDYYYIDDLLKSIDLLILDEWEKYDLMGVYIDMNLIKELLLKLNLILKNWDKNYKTTERLVILTTFCVFYHQGLIYNTYSEKYIKNSEENIANFCNSASMWISSVFWENNFFSSEKKYMSLLSECYKYNLYWIKKKY